MKNRPNHLVPLLEKERLAAPAGPAAQGWQEQFPLRPVFLALMMGLTLPWAAKADVFYTSQATLVFGLAEETLAIRALSGTDPSSVLQYHCTVDTATGAFSWSTVPGLTYDGQSYSASAVGSYDSSSATYSSAVSGELGSSSFTGESQSQWVAETEVVSIGGEYADGNGNSVGVQGNASIDDAGNIVGGVVEVGGVAYPIISGSLHDGDCSINYDDSYLDGHNIFGAQGYVTVRSIPEPSSMALAGVAAIAWLVSARKRPAQRSIYIF